MFYFIVENGWVQRDRARCFTFSPRRLGASLSCCVVCLRVVLAFLFCWLVFWLYPGFLHGICQGPIRASSYSRPQTFRWPSEPWCAHGCSSKKKEWWSVSFFRVVWKWKIGCCWPDRKGICGRCIKSCSLGTFYQDEEFLLNFRMSAAERMACTPLQRWLRSTRRQMQFLPNYEGDIWLLFTSCILDELCWPAEQYIYQQMTDFRERRASNITPRKRAETSDLRFLSNVFLHNVVKSSSNKNTKQMTISAYNAGFKPCCWLARLRSCKLLTWPPIHSGMVSTLMKERSCHRYLELESNDCSAPACSAPSMTWHRNGLLVSSCCCKHKPTSGHRAWSKLVNLVETVEWPKLEEMFFAVFGVVLIWYWIKERLVAVIFEWSADAWWIFAARFLCGHKLLQVSVRRDLLDWADNMYFAVD